MVDICVMSDKTLVCERLISFSTNILREAILSARQVNTIPMLKQKSHNRNLRSKYRFYKRARARSLARARAHTHTHTLYFFLYPFLIYGRKMVPFYLWKYVKYNEDNTLWWSCKPCDFERKFIVFVLRIKRWSMNTMN